MESLIIGSKRITTLLLFFVFFAGACTKKTQNSPVVAPPLRQFVLPIFEDPKDPRHGWIADFLSPRLSQVPDLSWTCGANHILVEGKSTWGCKEVKGTVPIECENDRVLRLAILGFRDLLSSNTLNTLQYFENVNKKCLPQNLIEALFSHIHIGGRNGVFEQESKDKLIPNLSLHPELESHLPILFRHEGPYTLENPDWKLWLSKASSSGAVSIDLSFLPSDDIAVLQKQARTLVDLKEFLGKIKESNFLKLFISTNVFIVPKLPPPKPDPKQNTVEMPLIFLEWSYKEKIFAETCAYLDEWLRARQLQHFISQNIDPFRKGKNPYPSAKLNCNFRWTEESPLHAYLSLARVPLPLSQNGQFPFMTSKEALSPTLLKSLVP